MESEASPCLRAFCEEMDLPSGVRGPVLLFVDICFTFLRGFALGNPSLTLRALAGHSSCGREWWKRKRTARWRSFLDFRLEWAVDTRPLPSFNVAMD